ncbi:MAG: hypothetical protein HY331_06820 [Chloroflexi bacterium]|nr:hypothetical protein [Chloroflexota bacterium]
MSLKWIALVLALGLALVLVGSAALELTSQPRPDRSLPTAPARAATVAGATTPVPKLMLPPPEAPTAPAGPAAAATGVSQDEAQQVVRAFFAALDAKDFQSARRLTAGQARETTDQIIGRVEAEAEARGVDLVIQTTRLNLAVPPAIGKPANVDADFSTDVSGKIGPVVVPGQTFSGRATFTIDRVDGQIRIVQMSSLGL